MAKPAVTCEVHAYITERYQCGDEVDSVTLHRQLPWYAINNISAALVQFVKEGRLAPLRRGRVEGTKKPVNIYTVTDAMSLPRKQRSGMCAHHRNIKPGTKHHDRLFPRTVTPKLSPEVRRIRLLRRRVHATLSNLFDQSIRLEEIEQELTDLETLLTPEGAPK